MNDDHRELYEIINLPQGAREQLNEYEKQRSKDLPVEIKEKLFCRDTWMIMPELELFLPSNSHIIQFKNLFDIDSVDYNQTWYMGWIFPGYSVINNDLPEKTTLHRKLKEHLLSGKKFGIVKGHLVMERVFCKS